MENRENFKEIFLISFARTKRQQYHVNNYLFIIVLWKENTLNYLTQFQFSVSTKDLLNFIYVQRSVLLLLHFFKEYKRSSNITSKYRKIYAELLFHANIYEIILKLLWMQIFHGNIFYIFMDLCRCCQISFLSLCFMEVCRSLF